LHNDETPPPHVKAKALFIAQKTAEKENTIMTKASTQAKEHSKTHQAVINEGTPMQTAAMTTALKEHASKPSKPHPEDITTEARRETSMTKPAEDVTKDDKQPNPATKETIVMNTQALVGTGQFKKLSFIVLSLDVYNVQRRPTLVQCNRVFSWWVEIVWMLS